MFGNYVKKVRTEKGLSQLDIASMIGINAQNISAIERGEVSPTLFWITRLCEGLQINPEDFMTDFYSKN